MPAVPCNSYECVGIWIVSSCNPLSGSMANLFSWQNCWSWSNTAMQLHFEQCKFPKHLRLGFRSCGTWIILGQLILPFLPEHLPCVKHELHSSLPPDKNSCISNSYCYFITQGLLDTSAFFQHSSQPMLCLHFISLFLFSCLWVCLVCYGIVSIRLVTISICSVLFCIYVTPSGFGIPHLIAEGCLLSCIGYWL